MLLGVVSQGTPPLVLLEMMKNGSLKEYLHSLRASKKQEERRPTEKVNFKMFWEFYFLKIFKYQLKYKFCNV